MRIAFVVHDARRGGGQDRYALELVNGLSKRHDVTLFARSAEGVAPGVDCRFISTPTRPWVLYADLFTRKVRRLVAERSWDIVHTVGGACPGASVVTAQFCQAAWREAQRQWPSRLLPAPERWYRTMNSRIAIASERRAARDRRLRALIAVSQRTAGEWQVHYGVSPAITTVIPNAVDRGRFRPLDSLARSEVLDRLGIPRDAQVLLTVGALVRKGIETLLKAMTRLPDSTYLVAVGSGPRRQIRALADRVGVDARLRLANVTPTIERYYGAADVFVFPTRYEPFGMVIAEAWACGLPVVASGVAGALEWAVQERHVLKIDSPDDDRGFADAVRRVLGESDLAKALRHHGLELTSSLTWDRVVEDTEAVYRSVVTRRARVGGARTPGPQRDAGDDGETS